MTLTLVTRESFEMFLAQVSRALERAWMMARGSAAVGGIQRLHTQKTLYQNQVYSLNGGNKMRSV